MDMPISTRETLTFEYFFMLLLVSESFRKHRTPAGHPERVERYAAVTDALKAIPNLEYAQARPATKEELGRVHKPEYIERIEQFCAAGGGQLDADTFAVPESWDAACRAAGACVQAVEYVLSGKGRAVFCAVRPPGHHARPAAPMGFCLFNNVAVGAAAAISVHGLQRILIVDWDLHHGNGTQEIFYEDPRVFYYSMHRWPFWPGTGSAQETGRGAGKGFTLNVPIAAGTQRQEVRALFRAGLEDIAARFAPELVIISAGFDMHRADPMGGNALEAEDYAEMTAEIAELFVKTEGRGIVSCLEGGYNLEALGASAARHVAALKAL